MGGFGGLVLELRRRRVFRTAALYIIAAWVALQVAALAFPGLDIPEDAIRFVWIGAFLGFPLALLFAWRYQITAAGIVRTPPLKREQAGPLSLQTQDYVLLIALLAIVVAVTYRLADAIREIEVSQSTLVREVVPYSIAVLPLDNLTGDPDQEYFVAGMHDALIADLSKISALKVISRTSASMYKDVVKSLPEIGHELGVANIVEGSVFRAGDRVRITVQLIDTKSDEHLWAENYERDIEDVLALQAEVSRAIAGQIHVTLTQGEQSLLSGHRPVNPAAYEAYLKGQFHVQRFTARDLDLALEYFHTALEIDPDFALAHVGVARVWGTRTQIGLVRPRDSALNEMLAIERALELDDTLVEANLALANIRCWDEWDWQAAEEAFRKVIDLNPNQAGARMFYGHLLGLLGRGEEGISQAEIALKLDPLNPFYRGLYGVVLMMVGRQWEAGEQLQKSLDMAPGLGFGYAPLRDLAHREGRFEEAFAAAKADFEIAQGDDEMAEMLERGYQRGGYREAMKLAAETLERRSETVYVSAIDVAVLYSHADLAGKSLEWLERAFEERNPGIPYIGIIPFSETVRDDHRFRELLGRLGLPDLLAEK
jgi:adenylate cyclase